ncbi:MAG: DUF4190 domain-containing protein [Actinomycetota bacterium]|nr:DUF4190 domain-containing protein [Actinomycetota bacterium]
MKPGFPEDNRHRAFPHAPQGIEIENVHHAPAQSEYNVLAISSMCCGILGLFMVQIVLAPAAIVLGALGYHSAQRSMTSTWRLAVAGYVLGIVDGIIWLILASVFHIPFFPL